MKRLSFLPVSVWLAMCVLAPAFCSQRAQGADLKVQAQLIWATNEPKSPNPKHHLLDEQDRLAAKLRNTYRWTNYFEINKTNVNIPVGSTNLEAISAKCKLEIANLGSDKVAIKLFGQGKEVGTLKDKVLAGWPLVLAGNSSNSNGWFVAIRKIDPKAADPQLRPESINATPAK